MTHSFFFIIGMSAYTSKAKTLYVLIVKYLLEEDRLKVSFDLSKEVGGKKTF